jgi:hypothetical protein
MTFCDIWGPVFDSVAYAQFLEKIFNRITIKNRIGKDGTAHVLRPTIKLVFPTKRAPIPGYAEGEWVDVDSADSMDSNFEYDYIEDEVSSKRKKVKRPKDLL